MRRLIRIFSSLKTGILLLVLITACSLVGVIIPQGLEPQRYVHKWGSVVGSLLLSTGLDHIFSTVWYNILLGVFSLNVLLCTSNRIRVSLRSLLHPAFYGAGKIAGLPLQVTGRADGTVAETRDRVQAFLRRRHYRVAMASEGEALVFDARRGALREVGMALLHLSVLPLLIGGLVGKMTGFSYPQMLGRGESAPVRERSFSVRCDYFELERNKDGMIKDYKSKLTLLDSAGDSLLSRVIEVNHPLIYKGIKFYQSSYSADPQRVDSVGLVIRGTAVGPVGKGVVASPGKATAVQGTDLSVMVHRFIPDFWIDMKTRQPQSRSLKHNNPAFLVSVAQAGDTLFKGWIFEKFGAMHHSSDTCSVMLMSYGQELATGLLVKENPGGPLIWMGLIFMTIGVLLVFWIPRRRLHIALVPTENGVSFSAGSSRLRNDPDAEPVFGEIVTALSTETGISLKETGNGSIN